MGRVFLGLYLGRVGPVAQCDGLFIGLVDMRRNGLTEPLRGDRDATSGDKPADEAAT